MSSEESRSPAAALHQRRDLMFVLDVQQSSILLPDDVVYRTVVLRTLMASAIVSVINTLPH